MAKPADRFRAAIASGAFSQADELLEEYRVEVEARWHGAANDAERSAVKTEVEDLLEWARKLTVIRRAHVQSKLVRLNSQQAYARRAEAESGRGGNVWEMQG